MMVIFPSTILPVVLFVGLYLVIVGVLENL